MTPAIPPDARKVVLAAVVPCPTCEGSLSVGEPGFTYHGIPEPGSYEACPDCMDDHGIPTGERTVVTDIEVEPDDAVSGDTTVRVWLEVQL
jgi:hypothetical protein